MKINKGPEQPESYKWNHSQSSGRAGQPLNFNHPERITLAGHPGHSERLKKG